MSCEIFVLLGCYAAYIGSYRRFWTTCRSHLEGSNINYKGRRFYLVVIPGEYPEGGRSVVVLTYQTTRCDNSEDHSASLHLYECLKYT
jgi:hypothetical protein